ncbi:MAG: calcium/sodium antiporter [Lachnospiraceae bacterium]|nr:calcium/sodium antiporter [Lachnospiraceae bacterium]
MELMITILLFLVGIVLIVKGGDLFVDAATWMAEVSGIPKVIIGATVVSLATTLPEMLVSVIAAVDGKVDMAVGNAVGSVTANIGLIMALSLVFMPGVINRKDYVPKAVLMFCASLVIVASGRAGNIGVFLSIILIAIFLLFLFENIRSTKNSMNKTGTAAQFDNKAAALHAAEGAAVLSKTQTQKSVVFINLAKFAAGAVGIVVGANLLVNNGSELARYIGISERIIGVTLVAVGTSLPELVTTITAIVKKQSSLSIGNILGANIIDLTLILPVSMVCAGKPLPIAASSAALDFPACLLVGCIAVFPMIITSKFKRWQGFALLGVYAVYLVLTCTA